jgi:hypothetical protein
MIQNWIRTQQQQNPVRLKTNFLDIIDAKILNKIQEN